MTQACLLRRLHDINYALVGSLGIGVDDHHRRFVGLPGTTSYTRSDTEQIAQDIDKVFAIFPRLKERALQLAGTMSGGEQQMLAMGRALMARPKVLLLDEPSMGLSPIMVDKIFEVVDTIHKQGTTILLVEQNASRALSLANRGYVMESGEVTGAPPWTLTPEGRKFSYQRCAAIAIAFSPTMSFGRPGAWTSPAEIIVVTPPCSELSIQFNCCWRGV